MKMNKSKIVVSALAVCMGAALVGSVSGTVAWYQYSTKASAAMMGTSAGVMRNLQIRLGEDGDWKQQLTTDDVKAWLLDVSTESGDKKNNHCDGTELKPVTTGVTTKDAVLPTLKGNPIFGYTSSSQWADAENTDYVVLPLYIRAIEQDEDKSTTEPTYIEKDIYLSDLTIENKTVSGKKDITDAVRVHFHTDSANALAAKTASSTNVFGKLDLNGDGELDHSEKYDFQKNGNYTPIIYGSENGVATSYACNDGSLIANTADSDGFTGGKKLMTTAADEEGSLVTVTIYIEGWQILSDQVEGENSIWNINSYVGSQFYVGMTFACQAGDAD